MTDVERDWVSRLADEVIAESDRRSPGRAVVCEWDALARRVADGSALPAP